MKFLKEKANMYVEKGAFVLGCVDETATLEMKDDELPEIFLQVPDTQASKRRISPTVYPEHCRPPSRTVSIQATTVPDCQCFPYSRASSEGTPYGAY